jgi:UDP-N-acetylglucosamine 2-epimerase (non-hydrolysing)
MKILNVVGARPNFMKVAPLHRAFLSHPEIQSLIVHTGQHYDVKMSDVFFQQLGMPVPDYFLGIGGGSHTQQTAKIMLAFEEVVEKEKPDVVLVVGDVNSTIACTLVAKKMGVPLVHVEAGLRSGDWTMPEEINRIMTDSVSDLLFVTEHSGLVHLAKEGVADSKIVFAGNVMIDSLVHFREKTREIALESLVPDLKKGEYVLMTMHRPANVDNREGLSSILKIVRYAASKKKVVFPIHPRTRKNIEQMGLGDELVSIPNLYLLEPQGYFEFLKLMDNAALIVTDSGGIQEETTYLQIPCLTFRDSTERPITVELGTNTLLADLNPETVYKNMDAVFAGNYKTGVVPPLWDGAASKRIAAELLCRYGKTVMA